MKKLTLISIIIAVFMLAGCTLGTTKIPYASSVPQEKLCTLRIVPTLKVTLFDGEEVEWIGDFVTWAEVQIPEGTHEFVLDYGSAHGYQNGIRFTSSFTAGRTYSMFAQPITRNTVRIGVVEGVL
ncbi:MAG: hypothetical protein LBM00_11230 [Deltaproteobacteria bacterium]|jgi:hypothetical protein|nr:hypothetical protein [Deltaproteobacteria bacterium]